MINQGSYLTNQKFETIPFVELLLPYTENFLNKIDDIGLVGTLVDKLHLTLLNQLSSIAEVVLQTELDLFNKHECNNFEAFIEKMNFLLEIKYPVLNNLLKLNTTNYLKHIQKINTRFHKDHKTIIGCFCKSKEKNITITDINTNLGDGHNGEGTTLVTLSDGTKLIYKPRNIAITNSYNLFIGWVNFKLNIDLATFRVISCKDYGWIGFVHFEGVSSEEELREYYYRAGILLAVTFLLGSKDCHRENIIASGRNPVMIDHETIIQPFLSDQSPGTWDKQHKIPRFSVLESILIVNQGTGMPLDGAGYGIKGNIQVTELEKKVIRPNTTGSKRVTRFVTRNLVDKNIPFHKGDYIFANNYKKYFIEGFSTAYDLFISSKEELKSHSSPILYFEDIEIRCVWRPTFVYFNILKYMRASSYMASFEAYNSKLYELMSKAYQKEGMEDYKAILGLEMEQMLTGNIPIFNLISTEKSLNGMEVVELFEYNCIENINHRIDILSLDHKAAQLKYITQWLDI